MAQNWNNVTHEKEEEIIGNRRKRSLFFKYHENCCPKYAFFYKQGCEQRWYDQKTVGICSETTGLGPKWVKIPEKKTLTSFSREHVFARLPHRSRDNSVSFGPNYFKISAIGPNCLFYILFYGISSTSNWSSFTVFWKYGPK